MNNEEFETMSQNAKTVINKFRDNPGKFAATILKMYWDMEKQRDQYKTERDTLKEENKKLKKENEDMLLEIEELEEENRQLREQILEITEDE
ncbi:MAG TPA: hypothetical protein K8V44_06595 [Staphylococcus saprophyticus]|nr:hypothetical protein [Staphylococcus saprophyticus]